MRTSFLTALVFAATFAAGAPLDTRGFPSFALGGNAQSGNSGNANGGGVYNAGGSLMTYFVPQTRPERVV
ncbi:hypothetical protein NLI96_g9874 [Meripilus lineatus]|uniref:Uncharacterized protein n=1 Tax=Meripilus lineatus TaxID=2056292 RepID=A0AAD5UUT0_9APHY|nr:hypothetical protein NLI96_g9874 [Physisporinus lineatus]